VLALPLEAEKQSHKKYQISTKKPAGLAPNVTGHCVSMMKGIVLLSFISCKGVGGGAERRGGAVAGGGRFGGAAGFIMPHLM
jgi:hypothetical protein